MISPVAFLAAVTTAVTVALCVRLLLPPPRSLASRIHPYLRPTARSGSRPAALSSGAFGEILGPIIRSVADWVGARLERSTGEVTVLRLRQAGWYRDLGEEEMVAAYRMAQLRTIALGVTIAVSAAWAIQMSAARVVMLGALGLVIGASRQRSLLGKAVEKRVERMKIEIYTVNQLLAMRIRAGGGVVNAVGQLVARGSGEVISELSDALRLHRSGWRAGDAFRRIAELTPEPFCGRTYRQLAAAEERGADLAGALLQLSEDVRETRRESIRRSATKRRAAMLVPTIAILAPVLILFVAAPLPYLITGWQ
ncbi:MAG: type II secretion system F family protein [Acidimicrobiia bacterium]